MTRSAYEKCKQDRAWQEVHARYLSRIPSVEVSAQQTFLDRMGDIAELAEIERKHEEEENA